MGYDIKWGVCERVWVSRCQSESARPGPAGRPDSAPERQIRGSWPRICRPPARATVPGPARAVLTVSRMPLASLIIMIILDQWPQRPVGLGLEPGRRMLQITSNLKNQAVPSYSVSRGNHCQAARARAPGRAMAARVARRRAVPVDATPGRAVVPVTVTPSRDAGGPPTAGPGHSVPRRGRV